MRKVDDCRINRKIYNNMDEALSLGYGHTSYLDTVGLMDLTKDLDWYEYLVMYAIEMIDLKSGIWSS